MLTLTDSAVSAIRTLTSQPEQPGGETGLRIMAQGDGGASSFQLALVDGPAAGEIDLAEAERRLADGPPLGSELRAAVRFLRAGGALAVITTPAYATAALDGTAEASQMLRIHRHLERPRSDAPVLTFGWG